MKYVNLFIMITLSCIFLYLLITMNLKTQKHEVSSMTEKNIISAKAYYQAIGNKNLVEVEKYLYPQVHFVGPLAEMAGKESVLKAVKGFMTIFKTLTVRAACGSGTSNVSL